MLVGGLGPAPREDKLACLPYTRKERVSGEIEFRGARCQHRPVGPGRREGPAAGRILVLAGSLGVPLSNLRKIETIA